MFHSNQKQFGRALLIGIAPARSAASPEGERSDELCGEHAE